MKYARIGPRGRITIPKPVRDALGYRAGDLVGFEVDGDQMVLTKDWAGQDGYLHGLSYAMAEWSSPEDEAAWADL